MALRIMDDTMTLETGNRVVATARFSEHAAADGNGAWIDSTCPALLFAAARRSRRWLSPSCQRSVTPTTIRL
jgi:hypothetical protein